MQALGCGKKDQEEGFCPQTASQVAEGFDEDEVARLIFMDR
jgi:hypothetical protein